MTASGFPGGLKRDKRPSLLSFPETHAAVPSPTHGNRLKYLVHAGVIGCARGGEIAGLALLFRLPHRCFIAEGARGNQESRQYEG